jgi:hypothetical protein
MLASSDMLTTLVNTEVMTAIDGAGADLQEARRAMRFIGAYNSDGEPVYERDYHLTIEAVKAAGELAAQVMPKSGGGVAVNVGINNNPNGNGIGGQGRSFEAMLREAEKKYQLTAGDPETIEAEVVEDENKDGVEEEETPDVELDDPEENEEGDES